MSTDKFEREKKSSIFRIWFFIKIKSLTTILFLLKVKNRIRIHLKKLVASARILPTGCPKIYRKSVLQMLQYRFAVEADAVQICGKCLGHLVKRIKHKLVPNIKQGQTVHRKVTEQQMNIRKNTFYPTKRIKHKLFLNRIKNKDKFMI